MPGVAVVMDAPDLRALGVDIRRASSRHRRLLTAALATVGESATRERIHAGGPAPDGTKWAPRQTPSSKPVLVRRGHLARSIRPASTPSTAEWGSRLIYARVHQLGATIRPTSKKMLRFIVGRKAVFAKAVTIPARPYLGWGDLERAEADDVIANWVAEAFPGRAGGRR